MVAKPDHRRVVVPARLRHVAARTLLARRPVGETRGARSRAVGRASDRALARRAITARRGIGEFGGCGG